MDLNVPITQQFRPEFDNRWQTEYQQTIARTAGLYESFPVTGEYREFPLLKKTDSVRKLTKRFEETAPEDISTGKRRVTTTPYLSALIFDRKDQQKFGTLESPIPASIANQRAETYRNQDATVVGTAGEVGGLLGKAIEVDAEGVVSYPDFDDSNYMIAPNYAYGVSGGANTGMTVDKLQFLKTRLGKLAVRSQDNSTNNPSPFGLLVGYTQVLDMLNDKKLNNRDEATAKLEQVAEGEIVDVCGFTIRALDDEHLPIDGSDIRSCIAFAKSAVAFGYNEQLTHELDVLPTKTHAIQSAFYFDWGFARIWDQGVWKIQCEEA